ncbi:MAG: GDSL-type esterase/lipase family protein, partial [Planctomycetota bacterium]
MHANKRSKVKNVLGSPEPRKPAFETLEPRTLFSATDLSILSFGDSITYGTGAGPDQSYRYYLTQALDQAGVSYDMVGGLDAGSGFDNDHHGIPGARANVSYWGSDGYRPSLTESLQNGDVLEAGQTPNVILLHVGTNSIRDFSSSVDSALGELDVLLTEMASQWRSGTFADDVTVLVADLIPGARSTDGSRTFSAERVANTHAY